VFIPANRFVCEYRGEIITSDEAEKRGRAYDRQGLSYLYDLDVESRSTNMYWYVILINQFLPFPSPTHSLTHSPSLFSVDATTMGNVARFINHSCDPNLQNFQVWVDSLDKEQPRIAFFSRRDIQPGEEITFDYKYEPLTKVARHLQCRCGAQNCRKYLY
jgi:histone-lysine N-methyltransferase SUV39H